MTGRRHFGSVRKLPSGRYQASYWHEGQRHKASGTFATKADADAHLDSVHADILRGGWVNPRAGQVSFGDYANEWLSSRSDLRPRSASVYRSLLDTHLMSTFGRTPIAKVSPSRVRTWYVSLTAEKPATAAAAYRLLRAIFATAVRDEKLLRSPCRIPGAGRDRTPERPMLTVAEVEALVEAMPEKLRLAVLLAAWGALRRGEILALRRKDFDPLRSLVRIERAQVELSDGTITDGPPKTDAGRRTVHLPDQAARATVDHLARYVGADPDAYLFTGRTGQPMRPKTLETAFTKARKHCGLAVHFHDLRHFSLTMAAATGATTKELMRRAGHASSRAALIYQHATENRDEVIAKALTDLVKPAEVVPIVRDTAKRSRT